MRAHFQRVVALKSVAAGSATWQSKSARQHAQHAQHNANLTSSLAHIWFRRRRGNTCVALVKGVAWWETGCGRQGAGGEGGKSDFCYAKRGDLLQDEPRQTGWEEEGVSNMTHFWAGRMRNWIYEYAYECAYYSHVREWSRTQHTHTQFALFCWWEFNKLRLRLAAAHKIPNGPQLLLRFSGNLSALTQPRPNPPPPPSTIFAPACLLSAVVLLVVGVWSPNAFAACTTNKFQSAHNMSNPIKGRNINHHTPSPLPPYA